MCYKTIKYTVCKLNLLQDIQIYCLQAKFVTRPSNILFASVYVSTFQPGNFIGWGSERVNEHGAKGWQKSRSQRNTRTCTVTVPVCPFCSSVLSVASNSVINVSLGFRIGPWLLVPF